MSRLDGSSERLAFAPVIAGVRIPFAIVTAAAPGRTGVGQITSDDRLPLAETTPNRAGGASSSWAHRAAATDTLLDPRPWPHGWPSLRSLVAPKATIRSGEQIASRTVRTPEPRHTVRRSTACRRNDCWVPVDHHSTPARYETSNASGLISTVLRVLTS